MSETPEKQSKPADLSALEGLTLGTAWSSASAPAESRPHREGREVREHRAPRTSRPEGRRAPARPEGFREHGAHRSRETSVQLPPSVKVVFYPEEAPFKALSKAIKASKRTYELFEIARLILEKQDCTVAVLSPLAKSELYQATPDGAVFLSENEALAHAACAGLEKFFKMEEMEVEAPKGNFTLVHRCGITGKLIAPPNYHRYAALLNEHQAKNLPQMPLAAVQAKLESVHEPEAIAQWLEGMKKVQRYTLLSTPEGEPPVSFDGADAAVAYLVAHHKEALVKASAQVRLGAKEVAALPKGEVRRSIEAARNMQTKFPLETANSLRGRLRRMGFNIYKRGQKGVSYLCAVRRKFRIVGQTFTPEVQQVIECIEKNPNVSDLELPKQMLGITPPAEKPQEGEVAKPALTAEEEEAWKKLKQTLQWLIEEGYVVHYGDGKLFVPPARLPNAPKEEGEEDEPADGTAEALEAEAVETEPAESTQEPNKPADKPAAEGEAAPQA